MTGTKLGWAERHESMNNHICFYCGAFGNTMDHVPAKNRSYDHKRIVVRACTQCNAILCDNDLPTTVERIGYLIMRYSNKLSGENRAYIIGHLAGALASALEADALLAALADTRVGRSESKEGPPESKERVVVKGAGRPLPAAPIASKGSNRPDQRTKPWKNQFGSGGGYDDEDNPNAGLDNNGKPGFARAGVKNIPKDRDKRMELEGCFIAPEKVCSRCGETKPHYEFNISRSGKTGLYSMCVECRRERSRKQKGVA